MLQLRKILNYDRLIIMIDNAPGGITILMA